MRRKLFAFFLLLPAMIFTQSVREEFSEVLTLWTRGNIPKALEKIEQIFYKPIPAENLSEFWYMRAKLLIEAGKVREAHESLKNILLVFPNQPEITSLLENVRFILEEGSAKSSSFSFERIYTISGFQNGIEYFFSPTSASVLGKHIYVVDSKNRRIVRTDGRTFQVEVLQYQPKQVFVLREGERYVVTNDGWVLKNDEKLEKFRNPIGCGFDEKGNFVLFDLDRVVVLGPERREYAVAGHPLVIDGEVFRGNVFLLDVWSNSLISINLRSGETSRIPLPALTRSFEIFYDGRFILLTHLGELCVFDGKMLTTLAKVSHYYDVEYDYPYLIGFDWLTNTIEINFLKSGEPVFVHIDQFKISRDRIYLYARVENALGKDVNLVHLFSEVLEARGKIPFDVDLETREYTFYISDEKFLTKKLFEVNDRKGYHVMVPPETPHSLEALLMLRFKNVKLWTTLEASEKLKDICYRSGGGVGEPYPLEHNVWIFSFPHLKPVGDEIIPVSVVYKLSKQTFSDTVYITKKVIELGLSGGF